MAPPKQQTIYSLDPEANKRLKTEKLLLVLTLIAG
jgi:hypothetical protein